MAMAAGLLLAVVSIPAALAAFAEGRAPRGGALALVVAGGLILWAMREAPGGYTLAGLPAVVIEVIARYLP